MFFSLVCLRSRQFSIEKKTSMSPTFEKSHYSNIHKIGRHLRNLYSGQVQNISFSTNLKSDKKTFSTMREQYYTAAIEVWTNTIAQRLCHLNMKGWSKVWEHKHYFTCHQHFNYTPQEICATFLTSMGCNISYSQLFLLNLWEEKVLCCTFPLTHIDRCQFHQSF